MRREPKSDEEYSEYKGDYVRCLSKELSICWRKSRLMVLGVEVRVGSYNRNKRG